jgi:hypothetical protein
MTLENDISQNTLNISTNATNTNLLATSVNTNTIETQILLTKAQNISSIPLETTLNGKLIIDGEIQQKAFTNEKHTQIETNKNNITTLGTNAISTSEREKLTHLTTHSATKFYIYGKDDRDIILHPGTGEVHLWTTVVRIGTSAPGALYINGGTSAPGSLHMNGKVQTKAYTDADYNLLQSINQTIINNNNNIKVFKEFQESWAIIDKNNAFHLLSARQSSSFFYNILLYPTLSNYSSSSGLWNGGPMRIKIKYSINFRSRKANMKKFTSQIRIHDVNNNVLVKNSLFQGVNSYYHHDFYDWINYNDEIVCDMENGYDLKLKTEWDLYPSNEIGDLKCIISIQQL